MYVVIMIARHYGSSSPLCFNFALGPLRVAYEIRQTNRTHVVQTKLAVTLLVCNGLSFEQILLLLLDLVMVLISGSSFLLLESDPGSTTSPASASVTNCLQV